MEYYEDVIDAYESGVGVEPGESLTDYIKRNNIDIIEMDTYRFRGHSMSDPGLYRTKDEVNKMKEIDPVLMMKESLLKEYKFEEDTIKDIESDIKKQIKDVEKFSLDARFEIV